MTPTSLPAVARRQLDLARAASSRRSAHTVHGGREHALRQTVMALLAGGHLHNSEHDHPAETTVQVLDGRVRLVAGAEVCDAVPGDLLVLPGRRHRLEALEDSVFLFTHAVDVRPGG